MDDNAIRDRGESGLFEGFIGVSAAMVSLFWDLSKYFGEDVCGVVAYSVGRVLGERLYKVARKRGIRDLRSANDLLVQAVKMLRLARDAAVFASRSEGDDVEIFFRVSSSAQICGKNGRPLLFIIRGFLFQFYAMFTSKFVTITSLDLSDALKDCYEYVVKISEPSSQPNTRREVRRDGR